MTEEDRKQLDTVIEEIIRIKQQDCREICREVNSVINAHTGICA